jgi:hypothetical protein
VDWRTEDLAEATRILPLLHKIEPSIYMGDATLSAGLARGFFGALARAGWCLFEFRNASAIAGVSPPMCFSFEQCSDRG